MILGVVSDTHNRLSNVEKIIDIFNEKNVDKVIHTGDITQAKTLSRFSRLNCPLIGVYGNNDLEEKGLKDIAKRNGFNFQNPPFFLTISNKKIAIFHEPEDINLVELHDCFATAEMLHYENLGLCGDGEAGRMIDEGEVELGGRVPVNVSGGLLSKGHPLGCLLYTSDAADE